MSSILTKNRIKNLRSKTVEIRRAISALDYVASGTLHTRMKSCGRPNCRCAKDPKALHGPYYEWNRWIDGKLVHRIISREQAEIVTRALENMKEVKRLLSLWEDETALEILGDKAPKKRRNPS
jgi:hypothetical protein